MKNILLLICNLSAVAFVIAAICSLLNYLFGLRIAVRGSALPDDPVSAGAFLVVAGIFGGIGYLLGRKSKVETENP
jgi:hypothetical protein